MGEPVVVVSSGGIPVTDTVNAEPVTSAAKGVPVTKVNSGGYPVTFTGFEPGNLFSSGEDGFWFDVALSSIYQEHTATTPSGVGDPVGYIEDLTTNGIDGVQVVASARPTLTATGVSFDGVDDNLDFTMPTDFTGDFVLVTAAGVAHGSVSITGTSWNYTVNPTSVLACCMQAMVAIDRALTAEEVANLVTYYTDRITETVTTFSYAFNDRTDLTALAFPSYDTSSVTDMSSAFRDCTNLTDLDVSGLDVSSVISFYFAFRNCSALTALDVHGFDTSSATNMNSMFRSCASNVITGIDQFDIEGVSNFTSFLNGSGLSTLEYDALLVSFASQDAVNLLTVDFGGSKYTPGGVAEAARTSLATVDSWTIIDGGPSAP